MILFGFSLYFDFELIVKQIRVIEDISTVIEIVLDGSWVLGSYHWELH
jgi:hypothetical protein